MVLSIIGNLIMNAIRERIPQISFRTKNPTAIPIKSQLLASCDLVMRIMSKAAIIAAEPRTILNRTKTISPLDIFCINKKGRMAYISHSAYYKNLSVFCYLACANLMPTSETLYFFSL